MSTVTFDQFNASLPNKSINLFKPQMNGNVDRARKRKASLWPLCTVRLCLCNTSVRKKNWFQNAWEGKSIVNSTTPPMNSPVRSGLTLSWSPLMNRCKKYALMDCFQCFTDCLTLICLHATRMASRLIYVWAENGLSIMTERERESKRAGRLI